MTEGTDRMSDLRFGLFVFPLPQPLAAKVDRLRQRFDPRSAASASPHISVTQPLADDPNDIARADLGAILAEAVPFSVEIGPARQFPGSPVVYFQVSPPEPVLALRDAAHATGLFRLDLPFTTGFVPHVTIREWPPEGEMADEVERLIAEADAAVGPTTIRCEVLELWRPDLSWRFSAIDRVRLMGS